MKRHPGLAVALHLSGAALTSSTPNHALLQAVAAVARYGVDRLNTDANRNRARNLSYVHDRMADTEFVSQVRRYWGGLRRRDLCHSLAARLIWQVGKAGAR